MFFFHLDVNDLNLHDEKQTKTTKKSCKHFYSERQHF